MQAINRWFSESKIAIALTDGFFIGFLFSSYCSFNYYNDGFPLLIILIVSLSSLFCIFYNHYYPSMRDMSTTQLAGIFLMTSLYLLMYLTPRIQEIVLNNTSLLVKKLYNLQESEWYRGTITSIIFIGLVAIPYYCAGSNQSIARLWTVFLISSLNAFLHFSLHLQGNIGKTVVSLWHQLPSQPVAIQLLGNTSSQVIGYPTLISLVIILALPVLLWIRTGIALLSRNRYFAYLIEHLHNYYQK